MTMTQQGQQQPGPGSFFDVPGIGGGTQWTDQFETTRQLATVANSGAQVPVNGILQFRQTDVVIDWVLELNVAQVYTPGSSTIVASPYAPWNMVGPLQLPIQNQYNSVQVESGVDLYIFNLIRPWRSTFARSNNYANPAGSTAGGTALGYEALANAQANLIVPAQWTTASTTWNQLLRLPASMSFDAYFDLTIDGQPTTGIPHAAIVSPQYMAGSTRVITPTMTLNPLGIQAGVNTLDGSVANITAGSGTSTATVTTTFRRKAVYAGDPRLMPPVYPWQYRWRTQRFPLAGSQNLNLQLPLDTGQLLMVYIRMWDPSSNTLAAGAGAPIQLAALTRVQLQYGSGLFAFDGTPLELQADFLEKHGTLPPPGVLVFDLLLDERGNRTNRRALNTLTTAGILVNLQFTAATSANAYAVMGTESLVYVA